MPNAVARFDEDFDDAPVRKRAATKKPRGASVGRGKKKARRWFAVDMTRVARWGAIGMSVTVGLGIVVNALMWQKGHHPAPLFGQTIATQTSVPLPPPAPVRTAKVDPAPVAAATEAEESQTAGVAKPHHAATASRDATEDGDDPIARLLSGGSARSAAKAAGKTVAAKPPAEKSDAKPDAKTVLGVQKALIKLGFVVQPNGTMGPATKKAIAAFEKDRHLTTKGDLNRRLVKALSAESGVKID